MMGPRTISPTVGEPRRIAVFRALQLGDMLCAIPALRSLRAGFPNAHIDLVGLPWAREFATRFSCYLDGFVAFPGYPGLPERQPDIAHLPRFFAEMQAIGYDLAIQMHGNGAITNPLTLLFGARRAAGFFRHGDYCPGGETFIPYPDHLPEPERHLALVHELGAPDCGNELEFPITAGDRLDLEAALAARPLGAPYACLHPGSRAEARRWPPAHFATIGDALARQGLEVILTGSEGERSITAEVASRMHASARDLAGRTSLGALAALAGHASLLVCNDTGVSHLAAALGTPSVVVFRASESARWAPLDGRLHRAVEPSLTTGGPDPDAVLTEAQTLLQRETTLAAR